VRTIVNNADKCGFPLSSSGTRLNTFSWSMLLVKRAIILSYFPSVLLRNLCTFWKFICYSKFMCFNLTWYQAHEFLYINHIALSTPSVLPQHPPSNVSIISGHNYSTLPPYTTQGTLVLMHRQVWFYFKFFGNSFKYFFVINVVSETCNNT
jgi:hypothetical protein